MLDSYITQIVENFSLLVIRYHKLIQRMPCIVTEVKTQSSANSYNQQTTRSMAIFKLPLNSQIPNATNVKTWDTLTLINEKVRIIRNFEDTLFEFRVLFQ